MADKSKKVSLGMGFAVIGSELTTMTLLGVVVDYFAGTKGGFTLLFAVFGMVAAVLLTMRLLKAEERERKQSP